jgi:NADPH:quinone reductase-like Zn-dependent oxidoreductase
LSGSEKQQDPKISVSLRKAIVCPNDWLPEVLQLKEVAKPGPLDNNVLVKVLAASVNPLDLQMKGGPVRLWAGLRRPKDPRLGRDIARMVESVGSKVTRFK